LPDRFALPGKAGYEAAGLCSPGDFFKGIVYFPTTIFPAPSFLAVNCHIPN
jgi:hypothetical protein